MQKFLKKVFRYYFQKKCKILENEIKTIDEIFDEYIIKDFYWIFFTFLLYNIKYVFSKFSCIFKKEIHLKKYTSFKCNIFLKDKHITINYIHKKKEQFAWCINLKNIAISNYRIIYPSSFMNCFSLQTVHIGKETEEIAPFSFVNCVSLKTVYIPKTIKKINIYAFKNCVSLEKVVFY